MSKLLFTLSCLLCLSLTTTAVSLVLHQNGALVPEDTPEVVAARDLHYEAHSLAAAAAEDDEDKGVAGFAVGLGFKLACKVGNCKKHCRKVICKACPGCL
jgi:hypothetical protein